MELLTKTLSRQTTILSVQGRLDAGTAPSFKSAIQEILSGETSELIIELSQTDFIDSSGLSAIVSALKRVNTKKGALLLAAPKMQAKVTLRLTMLDQILPIFPSLEEAIQALDITRTPQEIDGNSASMNDSEGV